MSSEMRQEATGKGNYWRIGNAQGAINQLVY
jgi:hypothetical protein